MLAVLASMFVLGQAQVEPIHPSLVLGSPSFEAVWAKGFKDGMQKRDINKAIDRAKRQIDSHKTGVLSRSGSSWAYFLHPRLFAYMASHLAAKQYWGETDCAKAKAEMALLANAEPSYIGFYVQLNEMPSFGGNGRLKRFADPNNLSDIRCVLKVGDRVIQPVKQPGNLTLSKSDAISFFSVPTTSYVTGQSNSSATIRGNGGSATVNGYGSSSFIVTTYSEGEQPYSTYHAEFIALFPVRSPEGKPLITPQDKQVSLVVVKRTAELVASYNLEEWATAFDK